MKKRKNKIKKHAKLQIVTLCISTALVLILLGLVVLTGLTANNLSAYVKENLTVSIIFDDNVSNQQAQAVCNKLRKARYVKQLEFISKDQALKENTVALGTDPSEFLGTNPFTPSGEIYLSAAYANSDSVKWIMKELKSNPQIEEVTYQQDLMDSVNLNLQKIMIVILILAALLTFVSFSLINNTVRLAIYSRRFAINTMKLVGASWSFIRAPFLRNALVEGAVAAILANGVLGGCVYALYCYEPDIIFVLTPEVLAITGGAVLLFGLIITTLCVYFSLNYFLKLRAKQLYNV